jgi:hypothetical protein
MAGPSGSSSEEGASLESCLDDLKHELSQVTEEIRELRELLLRAVMVQDQEEGPSSDPPPPA